MKFSLLVLLRKIAAWFMTAMMAIGIGGGTVQEPAIQRGEENSVTAYDKNNADYTLSIDAADEVHEISELLYGIFFEDINFAADGGLYGELVINRSFDRWVPLTLM